MSRARGKRRTWLDAGDGITIAVSHRGELSADDSAALTEIARAAAEMMRDQPPPVHRPGPRLALEQELAE